MCTYNPTIMKNFSIILLDGIIRRQPLNKADSPLSMRSRVRERHCASEGGKRGRKVQKDGGKVQSTQVRAVLKVLGVRRTAPFQLLPQT